MALLRRCDEPRHVTLVFLAIVRSALTRCAPGIKAPHGVDMIEACISSQTGACRRVNEDRGLADAAKGIIAVFDGSAADGAAADVALAHTEALSPQALGAGAATLRKLAGDIDAAIRQSPDPRLSHSVTTLLVAVAQGHLTTLAHIGDGRAYLFRDGALTQLSTDHTLVEELRASGQLSAQQALEAPNRTVITRALGFGVNCEPDVYEVETRPGDIVVLCTDGVWRDVDEQQLTQALVGGAFAECADRITQLAAAPGRDNSTVAAARF